jgi:5-methylcytosine-specific restriction endonuclease McrA
LAEFYKTAYEYGLGVTSHCKLCIKKSRKRSYVKHREKRVATSKAYYENNKDKIKASRKRYRQSSEGKAKINARNNKRKAQKLQATPKWLTEEHFKQIEQFYIAAKDLRWEDEMHVDHIVPLNGVTISGLHVPWNLQLLTKEENLRKGNKF